MQRFGDNDGFYVVNTPLAVLDAVGKVKGIDVEFAEPNYTYQHELTSNDSYFTNGSLWGMYGDASTPSNQYGCQAAELPAILFRYIQDTNQSGHLLKHRNKF